MSNNVSLQCYPDNETYFYRKSDKVETITADIISLAHYMAQIMYDHEENGVSGPHFGLNKRIVVFDCTDDYSNTVYLINPVILWQSRETSQCLETCLGYPGLSLPVNRPNKIKIEALDINGKKIGFEATGKYARIVHQQIDLLDGIPFTQRVSRQIRRHLIRKWTKQNE